MKEQKENELRGFKKKLQKIIENINAIESIADFDSDQWKRGNANIKRRDNSISLLNINIRNNEYGVGIDGNHKGDILDYLKNNNFKLNNQNDQNERYKVSPEKIEEVVRHYAEVKKTKYERKV